MPPYFNYNDNCILPDSRCGLLSAQGRRLRGEVAELQAVPGAPHQESQDVKGTALLSQGHVREARE